MAKKALGRGLGALIGKPGPRPSSDRQETGPVPPAPVPPPAAPPVETGEKVVQWAASDIVPSPLQPRTNFGGDELEELMASIKEHGVIQPLIVREVGGKAELIAGERRWRASVRLGLKELPVIVRQASDQDVLEMALIENLQREDLNPIEEAHAYERLAGEFEMRQEDIARHVGKSRAAVANTLRLLDLDTEVQGLVGSGQLSAGHGKAVLGLKEPAEQRLAAEVILRRRLSVRAAEQLVSQQLNPKPARTGTKSGKGAKASPAVLAVQSRLREHFATNVQVAHGEKKGKIEIEYYGNDDLQRILTVMGIEREGDV